MMKRITCFIFLCGIACAADSTDSNFALRNGDRVVFYGDSITQNGGYALLVEQYARNRFPEWSLQFYNAGVGGDTVAGGAAGDIDTRLARDVIRLKPTVVTIMLGMNDGHYRALDPATLATFTDGYRSLVSHLKSALPDARIYLIRTSPFDEYTGTPDYGQDYNLALGQLGDAVASVGQANQIPVLDFGLPAIEGIKHVAQANLALSRQLLPDRVHPSAAAHLLLGATLLRFWQAPSLVTRVEIDAHAGKLVSAENTQVAALATSDARLTWTQLDRALPLPLNYDDADAQLAQLAGANLDSLNQQPLILTGLSPGRYELTIDERKFGPFTAGELATGINLARYNTPMRGQAYQVRWSAEGGHERQRVARRAQAAVAESLSLAEESAQNIRSRPAVPLLRKYSIQRIP